MAAGDKIDILLLRDTAGVRRFRVSVLFLRLLWIVPLALLVLLAAVVTIGYRLRQDNLALTAKTRTMQAELAGAGTQLVKLQNIEKILRSRDVTELETLIGSYNAENPGWWKPGSDGDGLAATVAGMPSRPDLTHLLARLDANQAGVDNLRVRIENKKLLLNFDLSNVTPETNLTGKVQVALVGNDASLVPLVSDKDDLSFQIQRFKQIAASLPLPARLDRRGIYGIRLSIVDSDGKAVFSRVYPLSPDERTS